MTVSEVHLLAASAAIVPGLNALLWGLHIEKRKTSGEHLDHVYVLFSSPLDPFACMQRSHII